MIIIIIMRASCSAGSAIGDTCVCMCSERSEVADDTLFSMLSISGLLSSTSPPAHRQPPLAPPWRRRRPRRWRRREGVLYRSKTALHRAIYNAGRPHVPPPDGHLRYSPTVARRCRPDYDRQSLRLSPANDTVVVERRRRSRLDWNRTGRQQ